MKFHIDTVAKTITLTEPANVGDVMELLQKMFPDQWKEYRLLQHTETRVEYVPEPTRKRWLSFEPQCVEPYKITCTDFPLKIPRTIR